MEIWITAANLMLHPARQISWMQTRRFDRPGSLNIEMVMGIHLNIMRQTDFYKVIKSSKEVKQAWIY